MISYLITGVVLGLSAGSSPGPLMTLVISQTLRHGFKEGIKVALAPLVSDLPIVLATVLLLSRVGNSKTILSLIALAGGVFILYLAYESFRVKQLEVGIIDGEPRSLGKGAIVNLLNPSPYLFWSAVGAPTLVQAWAESPLAAAAFALGFYFFLMGAKIALAGAVAKSKYFVTGKRYLYLMRCLGILLLIFGVLLFKSGMAGLGLVPTFLASE